MSIQSGQFDITKIRTLAGNPYPCSSFAEFVCNETSHRPGHSHPENIDVSLSSDLNPAIINKMVFYGESPEDLWYNLERSINHLSSPSPYQRKAIKRFRTLKDRYLHSKPLKALENEKMFRGFYRAFDDIFFFNSLLGLCEIAVCPPGSMGAKLGATHRVGCTVIPDGYVNLIAIQDTTERYTEASRAFRLNDYLETLLHEMLHAYFRVYTCGCSASCVGRQEQMIGSTGHGMAWMWTALRIEEVTEPLLGVRLDMALGDFSFEDDAYREAIPVDVRRKWGVDN
ncbi:hypothetical protein BKA65DRAFT_599313 [Rhexocercosporidium sp. MPI-PUGE-AT-0058]|nr:hypothetical protein BKA65DRAFT_599313 [Rhexocercosporidium sp. MPI-PUGE-AT-0058]